MNKKLLMPCLASLPIEELVGVPLHVFCSILVSTKFGRCQELLRAKDYSGRPTKSSGMAVYFRLLILTA